jgi:hypothetical protein
MPQTSRRLAELLTVLGSLDEIAPSDTPLIGKRAGDLLARSAITPFANTQATEAPREVSHDVPRRTSHQEPE